ncbi:MAG: hypothetical protein B9S26_11275 [Opitutia bacterium Tous-C4FEB]|nr:MAG: hypothetical protein B9S35_07795 [Opitutae bacterium Tous-C5TDCM]PAW88655.1 MAG: hypothetical protein B9S26_11275 [Opitutae bacterium Tous-C4FEB]
MLLFLRLLFIAIFTAMLWVTSWASVGQPLGEFIAGPVIRDRWVVATLFDAYFAFIAFFVWVAWKETTLALRVLWFIAIILWGNLAMSLYLLVELFRISRLDELDQVFTRRNPPRLALPVGLALVGVAIYTLGFWSLLK